MNLLRLDVLSRVWRRNPPELVGPLPPRSCLENCGRQVEQWLVGSFCMACIRRTRARLYVDRALSLVVEQDDVAAEMAAILMDRLSRPR